MKAQRSAAAENHRSFSLARLRHEPCSAQLVGDAASDTGAEIKRAAKLRRSIKCSAVLGNEPGYRLGAVAASESPEHGFGPRGLTRRRRGQLEDDAATREGDATGAAGIRGSIKRPGPVGDERGQGEPPSLPPVKA